MVNVAKRREYEILRYNKMPFLQLEGIDSEERIYGVILYPSIDCLRISSEHNDAFYPVRISNKARTRFFQLSNLELADFVDNIARYERGNPKLDVPRLICLRDIGKDLVNSKLIRVPVEESKEGYL